MPDPLRRERAGPCAARLEAERVARPGTSSRSPCVSVFQAVAGVAPSLVSLPAAASTKWLPAPGVAALHRDAALRAAAAAARLRRRRQPALPAPPPVRRARPAVPRRRRPAPRQIAAAAPAAARGAAAAAPRPPPPRPGSRRQYHLDRCRPRRHRAPRRHRPSPRPRLRRWSPPLHRQFPDRRRSRLTHCRPCFRPSRPPSRRFRPSQRSPALPPVPPSPAPRPRAGGGEGSRETHPYSKGEAAHAWLMCRHARFLIRKATAGLPSTPRATSATCSGVKPYSRITTSPGADAPKRSTDDVARVADPAIPAERVARPRPRAAPSPPAAARASRYAAVLLLEQLPRRHRHQPHPNALARAARRRRDDQRHLRAGRDQDESGVAVRARG